MIVLFVLFAVAGGTILGIGGTSWWYARQGFSSGEAVTAAGYAAVFIGGPAGAISGFIAAWALIVLIGRAGHSSRSNRDHRP
jgi:hypothetical protein